MKHVFNGVKVLVSCVALCACILQAAPVEKPNIILFYVDDLGWMDLSCQGSEFYETPNIDRLAAEGVRFMQGYTPHPRCLPARYGVLTGRFPGREKVPGGGTLKPNDVTIAEALREGGYTTFFGGKYHLIGKHGEANLPENQGFDVNISGGAAGAPPTYFYPYCKGPKDKRPKGWELGLSKKALAGFEDGKEGDYVTEALTDKTLAFIRENKNIPFFVYLSHYGVHTPYEAPERLIKKYEKKLQKMKYDVPEYEQTRTGDNKLRQDFPVYAAMIESVDESMGRLLEELETLGIADKTVIVFTADNGGLSARGNTRKTATSNRPLRTGKGWLYEGGIREPFIVKWPGVTEAGTLNEKSIITASDLYPTFLEIAGLPLRPKDHKDGISITGALKDSAWIRPTPIFWHSPTARPTKTGDLNSTAIREGDWKLIDWYDEERVELFNLKDDISEAHDLSKQMPEKTAELKAKVDAWRKDVKALIK
jgi:arylsulfatase A-like enzyme